MYTKMLAAILNLIFPKKCVNCSKAGEFLCTACIEKITWHEEAKCLMCGGRAIGGYTHPRCLGNWSLDRSILLAYHRGPIRKLIHSLKYRKLSSEAGFVARLMAERLEKGELEGFVVAAVPLYFAREMARGFNQAEALGRELAKNLSLPYRGDWWYRTRGTETQTELDKKDRSKNVQHAFRIYSRDGLKGAKVLLVDDVITTGATVRECAKVLKRSGAREVWVLALAHG